MSPASPLKAIKVFLFRARVLLSDAFRIVAPRIAALEAAMIVKSLPEIPKRASLEKMSVQLVPGWSYSGVWQLSCTF